MLISSRPLSIVTWLLLLLLLLHPFNGLFSSTTWVSQYQKGKTSQDLNDRGKRWWMQWHQLDHMQTICISLQTDNHTSTSSVIIYRPDALPDAQPTVSKHWRQVINRDKEKPRRDKGRRRSYSETVVPGCRRRGGWYDVNVRWTVADDAVTVGDDALFIRHDARARVIRLQRTCRPHATHSHRLN